MPPGARLCLGRPGWLSCPPAFGGSLNGVEEVWGLGLALLGLVLSFISSRVGRARFYSDPSVSHGDTVEEELAGAVAVAEAGAGAESDSGVADESA